MLIGMCGPTQLMPCAEVCGSRHHRLIMLCSPAQNAWCPAIAMLDHYHKFKAGWAGRVSAAWCAAAQACKDDVETLCSRLADGESSLSCLRYTSVCSDTQMHRLMQTLPACGFAYVVAGKHHFVTVAWGRSKLGQALLGSCAYKVA